MCYAPVSQPIPTTDRMRLWSFPHPYGALSPADRIGLASGLAAHLTASVLSGSTLSQERHKNSVRPSGPRTVFIRFVHLGQRSMMTFLSVANDRVEPKFPLVP